MEVVMKRIFTVGLIAMSVAAVPASAQSWGNGGWRYGNGYGGYGSQARGLCDGSRADALHRRVAQERREGDLNRGQAYNFNNHIRLIEQTADRYCSGGLSRWEARSIDNSFDQIEAAIEQRDSDGRGSGWDRGYSYGNYDRGDTYGNYYRDR
jgi:hypothetical protein